jgi:RNA polymerase sigma-70 factor (ECF subfamily)
VSRSASESRGDGEVRAGGGSASEAAAVRAVVRAVRGGDRSAFAELVDRYQRRLFGLALMMLRDPSAAEDVAQDAFVRAFTHLDSYDERRPFYPWLATIAVRLAQNQLRRRATATARASEREPADLPATSTVDPLGEVVAEERSRRLWRQVAALPSGQRTAVALHYRDGLKVNEIASALGVTSGTIKTLLFRARRRLREALAPVGGDSEKTT